MIYFFYGPDSTLLSQKVKTEVRGKVDISDQLQFIKFNLFQDTVQDVVMESLSTSFLGEPKVVVLENCYFLSNSKEKVPPLDKQQDFKSLIDYINFPNPDTNLYLLMVGKPNKKSEIVSLLEKKAIVVEVNNLTDEEFVETANALAKEYNGDIDRESVTEIVKRSGRDYTMFVNNVRKLFTYTNQIRIMDVQQLVNNPLSDDVFSLFESLINNDRPTQAIRITRNLFKMGYDTYKLLPVLASQFSFLAEVAYLDSRGSTEKEIADSLRCHPYRVKCSRRNLKYLDFNIIIEIMSDLSELERNLKYNLDDPQTALELFICNFRRNYLMRK